MNLLNELVREYDSADEFKRQVAHYNEAVKTDDWKFLRDMLLLMKAKIVQELLSQRFTKLDKNEKDVQQRTYQQVVSTIDFLLNPLGWIKQKKSRWTLHK